MKIALISNMTPAAENLLTETLLKDLFLKYDKARNPNHERCGNTNDVDTAPVW